LHMTRPAAAEAKGPRRVDRALAALLIAAATLPPLLFGLAAWTAWGQSWAGAMTSVERAAAAGAEYARRVLDGHALRLERANDLLEALTDDQIRAQEARLRGAFARIGGGSPDSLPLLTLLAFDRNAALLVGGTSAPAALQQRLFDDRDFILGLRGADPPQFFLGRVHVGQVTGRAFFAVSRRRTGSGNPLPPDGYDGAIVVAAYPDEAGAALGRLPPEAGDITALLRTDGEVLARSGSALPLEELSRIPKQHPMVLAMARGAEHAVVRFVSPIDGVRRFSVLRRVEGWPAYVVAGRPLAAVIAEWWRIIAGQLAIAVPAWALLLGMTVMVWRRKRALTETNAALEARVEARTAELTAHGEALAESEARLRLAQQAARVGTWELDLATRKRRWSPEQFMLYGLPPAADGFLSDGLFIAMVHPDDRAAIRLAETRARATGDFEAEFRILRPALEREDDAPELRWLLSRGRLLRGRDGRADRIIGINVDITSRRQGEERRDLVAREVAHRARNALQLVLSAVAMTKAPTVAEFARLLRGRVCALARAQALLVQSGGLSADLRTLAEGEVLMLAGGADDAARVRLDGPPVEIEQCAVQPLSMALHELATNAAKYGALSVAGGTVTLSWTIDEAAALLRLRWQEEHGPAVTAPPDRLGFGSTVLEATLTSQLGGRVLRDWSSAGLVLVITLPLERVRRQAALAFGVD